MMRSAFTLLLLASVAYGWPTQPAKPRTFQTNPQHADNAIIEALIFLETRVDPADWQLYQFFEFLDSSDADLEEHVTNFKAYLPMVSQGFVPAHPIPVDRAGRVWVVDFRQTGWNRDAVHAVARLDTKLRQPHINGQLANELRRAVGATLDKSTYHCEGMLPGNWFIRELQQTVRHRNDPENIAYYNLLFARERFGGYDYFDDPADRHDRKTATVGRGPKPEYPPEKSEWPGGIWPKEQGGDGQFWAKGSIKPRTQWDIDQYNKALAEWEKAGESKVAKGLGTFHKSIARDFPRDATDWENKWGITDVRKYLSRERLFKKNGTVIAGFKNDPKNGSIVSYNDRVNVFYNAPLGIAMRTYDFDITAGKKNPAERPLEVALEELEEDAAEHIVQKADNFPAFLLTGGAKQGRKRVEFGDPLIVRNSLDPHAGAVLTFDGCILCHYPSNVILSPSNEKILRSLKSRNELFAYTKTEELIMNQFFADGDFVRGGWTKKLRGWREPFADSLLQVTATVANPKGWSGTLFSSRQQFIRDQYDLPVTFDQACAELGYPRLAVLYALLALGKFDAAELVIGENGIPRDVWDSDLYKQVAAYLAFARDSEFGDPLLLSFYPELVRDAKAELYRLKKRKD